MDATDSDIETRLLGLPPERWEPLWAAVDQLLAEQPSVWEFRTQNHDGSLCLPYAVYDDAVNRVHDALYRADVIVNFDWTSWDGVQRYRGEVLADAPVADACRMLTAIVRAERFSDGTIGRTLDDGTFQAALLRLRAWYDSVA
ncbi:DUF6508 domain-containing protein [Nocardia sp. NPDC059764]|uniref:DUF6508 domain-containing protein n=1 Tax=Nocardia sp. NPDC059764 TaxID=3346939 RepID=UPI0036651B93